MYMMMMPASFSKQKDKGNSEMNNAEKDNW